MNKVLFLFIDGVGIGKSDPELNPLVAYANAQLFPQDMTLGEEKTLPHGGKVKAIDARLIEEGIPQSATGQTSLFCGVNAPEMLGYHLFAFPNQNLRQVIKEKNTFKSLIAKGKKPLFLNAYAGVNDLLADDKKIDILEDGRYLAPEMDSGFLRKISVSTCQVLSSNRQFLGLAELKARTALSSDFLGRGIAQKYKLPELSPAEAAEVAIRRLTESDVDYLLYEYFFTDVQGHKRDRSIIADLVPNLESFILNLAEGCQREGITLMLTSDHGNLEDISHSQHTLNPVPLMVWPNTVDLSKVHAISDVHDLVVEEVCSA